MTRLGKLLQSILDNHFIQKEWDTLSVAERETVVRFIQQNDHLNYHDWAGLVNRMYLSSYNWPQTKNKRTVQNILATLSFTTLGMYGYEGDKRWVHPLDEGKES